VGAADEGVPTRPEVERLDGIRLGCIYGAEEEDSPCRTLGKARIEAIELPGGHHFNGDYERVARAVLQVAGAGGHNPGP
jgi:type IV secretory pathway VirJ component